MVDIKYNKFIYSKTCRGMFSYIKDNKQHIISTTGITRTNKFTNKPFLKNTYLQDILTNFIITNNVNMIDKQLTVEQLKILEESNVYIGYILNQKTYIRHFSYIKNMKLTSEMLTYKNIMDKKKSMSAGEYICPINEYNFTSLKKNNEYPTYFVDILFKTYGNMEKIFLENNLLLDFYMENDNIIIMPDMMHYPITIKDLESWNIIKDSKDTDLIYSFLLNLQFNVFFKDNDMTKETINNYKYKSIFHLLQNNTKSEIIELLQTTKSTIIQFMHQFLSTINEMQLNITINNDTKYNFMILTFNLVDIYYGYRSISYIDIYRTNLLDDLIKSLQSDDTISYFSRFTVDDKHNVNYVNNFCADNLQFIDDYHINEYLTEIHENPIKPQSTNIFTMLSEEMLGGNIENYYELLEPDLEALQKFKNITIINEWHKPDKINTYCTDYFLVQIDGDESYYEISIKRITYLILNEANDYIKNGKPVPEYINNFYKIFNEQLLNVLKYANTTNSIKYNKNSGKEIFEHIYADLPEFMQIMIKKVNYRVPPKRVYKLETYDDYMKKLLIIKNNQVNLQLILFLIYYSYLIRYIKRHNIINLYELYEHYLKNGSLPHNDSDEDIILYKYISFLKVHSYTEEIFKRKLHVYTDNFIIIDHQHENTHLLWYVHPEIQIYNIDMFINDIRIKLNEAVKSINPKIYNLSIEYMSIYTNFYNIYQTYSHFLYNLRHLTHEYKLEINLLINKLYNHNKKLLKHYTWNNHIIYAHYPNALYYNIFHLHITYSISNFIIIEDHMKRYNFMSEYRRFLWDIHLNIKNYKDADIILLEYINEIK